MEKNTCPRQAAVTALILIIAGACFFEVGILGVVFALALLGMNPSWAAVFDLAMATISLVFPAAQPIAVTVAYLEYCLAVLKE